MANYILVVSLLFALIVAIFAVQNNAPVDIRFLGWKYSNISLVLVIFGSAAAGAVSVFFLGFFKQMKLKIELRKIKAQNEKLNAQLSELKVAAEAQAQEEAAESTDKPDNSAAEK